MSPRALYAASFAALAALSACQRQTPTPPAETTTEPVVVRAAPAARVESAAVQEVLGTVRAKHRASIAPNVVGTVRRVHVTLGSEVRAGDVLARVHAGEIDARARQSVAVLDQAKLDLDRAARLEKSGVLAKAELDATSSRYRVAQATLSEARALQGHTVIRAPFAGVITEKRANPGDQALPGNPLFVLEDRTALRLEATVPEALASGLAMDQKATVRIDATNARLQAMVAEISPSADPGSRTVRVLLDLPSADGVRTGMFGRLLLPGAERTAIEIPKAALVRRGQMELAFVVEGERARLRIVRSSRARDDRVEIAAGLEAGERVITSGLEALRDGSLVKVQP
jgi:RND family efflux transporter MFP subunit